MAVIFKDENKCLYTGAVVATSEHYWLDGMHSQYAICWDKDKEDFVEVQYGYYGCDYYNLAGGECEVDVTTETAREIIRHFKAEAIESCAKSIAREKCAVKAGQQAEVIRGRKIPKGSVLDVFWVGERETYRSRQYAWMYETEEVAGCYDKDGNKVWIKKEYLKNITPIGSPRNGERKKYIKWYIKSALKETNVLNIARG